MDVEEIETTYKQDIERLEKSFLDGISKNENIIKLEKRYHKDTHKSKEKYYKLMSQLIEKQKKDAWKKPKNSKKQEVTKIFKVTHLDLKTTNYQKFKFLLSLKSFRYKIKIKNFFHMITPVFIRYSLIKSKINFKKGLIKTKEKIKSSAVWIKDTVIGIRNSTFEGIKDAYKFIIKVLKKISAIIKYPFKRKKKEKEENPEAKKEEEEEKTQED
jgi:hypothetical protein